MKEMTILVLIFSASAKQILWAFRVHHRSVERMNNVFSPSLSLPSLSGLFDAKKSLLLNSSRETEPKWTKKKLVIVLFKGRAKHCLGCFSGSVILEHKQKRVPFNDLQVKWRASVELFAGLFVEPCSKWYSHGGDNRIKVSRSPRSGKTSENKQ